MRTLRFAGNFLLAVVGVVGALWIIGKSLAFSPWAGYAAVAIVTIILYATAPHWVRWLPGLLVFGVINSLLGLVTHHAPSNPTSVTVGFAGLLTIFYALGCIVSYHYDAKHLSAVDRLALLVYLFCMIWPAFAANDVAAVTPAVPWSMGIGMAALVASFVAHRARRERMRLGS